MSAKIDDRRKPSDTPISSSNNPACDQCRTRKIRCDREAPSCSNCRKANLPCDFTNKGKRINHTKQLVEDFNSLSGRLESIDASIARITQRLELDSAGVSTALDLHSDAAPEDDLNHFTRQDSPSGSDEHSDTTNMAPEPTTRNNYYISRDPSGAEIYYGPTAARSLFQQIRTYTNDLLNSVKTEDDDTLSEDYKQLKSHLSSNPTARTELRKCNASFPFSPHNNGLLTAHDGRLVSCPPQSFIESSLDYYFEEFNTVLPLFDENHLRSVVREHYVAQRNFTTDAWNLCFNNIIVLVMGNKLKTALSMNVRRRDLENDIFLPFLSNSYRAFNNLNDYSTPQLVNVQALITLALVAADHFPFGVLETLIHKACALGREMGLERWTEKLSPTPNTIALERRRVFWALYVLDKRRTFLTGKPCDLYLAESDLDTPSFVPNEMWAKNSIARIHMMSIWEEIWKNLYSSRAMRNSSKFREDQINRLRAYLKGWVTHHKSVLERPEQVELGNVTCMRLELRYSFHVAQILVHRCLDKPDNLQQQINNARAALKIIKDISQGPATISGISLLGRLFRSYPILPFYEIFKRSMHETDDISSEDMDLMRACINAISIFHSPVQPEIYHNKLTDGLEWCFKMTSILRSVQERSQDSAPMSRSSSAGKVMGSPLARKSTGKRDSESVEEESSNDFDPRSQRRRVTSSNSNAANENVPSGTNTADTSQSGSAGPDTPQSGYFSDFNNIDPFSVDRKLGTFPVNQLTSPTNDLSGLTIPTASMGPPNIMMPVIDSKDVYSMDFVVNYPVPLGTINPARTTARQNSTRTASSPRSPRNNFTDLSSIVARLPPGGQQALTSVPPSAMFQPESFSAFNTDLLDDAFTNVGHHPDMISSMHHSGFNQFDFSFAAPEQIGFGPMDIMNMEGL